MLLDKDIASTLQPFRSLALNWHVAALGGPRGASADALLQVIPEATAHDSVANAMAEVMKHAAAEDLVIVFGSFYTVAEAKQFWRERK